MCRGRRGIMPQLEWWSVKRMPKSGGTFRSLWVTRKLKKVPSYSPELGSFHRTNALMRWPAACADWEQPWHESMNESPSAAVPSKRNMTGRDKSSMRAEHWLLIFVFLLSRSLVCCDGFVPVTLARSRPPSSSPSYLGSTLDSNQQQLLTEISVAAALGVLTEPIVEQVFNATHIRHSDLDEVDFKDTLLYGAADSISTAARVFGSLLVADLVLTKLGFVQLPFEADLGATAPSVAACLWAALTLSAVKRTIFYQGIAGNRLGRVALYDRLIDFLIAIGALSVILDVLKIDFGMGLQSLIAGSGIGAVIFSLASKDLASALVGGFIVQAWDNFEEGDEIRLQDGTEGKVKEIGLVETEITGYDNISIKIPNSQLTSTRVSNLSRIQRSRVYQTLRFSYSDLQKLPQVLDDIKSEIQFSCPKLVVDGSKPFQALLTSYQADHIEAIVNCHFDIPVSSGEYAENRQNVLLAISRALDKNDVRFALPSIVYQSREEIFENNGKDI